MITCSTETICGAVYHTREEGERKRRDPPSLAYCSRIDEERSGRDLATIANVFGRLSDWCLCEGTDRWLCQARRHFNHCISTAPPLCNRCQSQHLYCLLPFFFVRSFTTCAYTTVVLISISSLGPLAVGLDCLSPTL